MEGFVAKFADYTKIFRGAGSVEKTGTATFISRGLEYKSSDVMLRFDKELIRPHFEGFWASYLRKDVVAMEKVQRRFTRMMPG